MKFGQSTTQNSLHSSQFVLPPLDPRVSPWRSESSASKRTPEIYIGAPIWGKPEWVGKVFPPKTPSRLFLRHYAQQFNSIELNASAYKIPEPHTIQNWYESVPSDFRFCPKLYQGISQSADLGFRSEWIDVFCERMTSFQGKLGTTFLQLSPHFDRSKFTILEGFLKKFGERHPISVEFRHPSWFADQSLIHPAYQLLTHYKAGSIMTDVAERRDVLHASVTSPHVFVRFLGNNLHPTDFSRLDTWAIRLKDWIQLGVKQIYFFIHQSDEITVPELSRYLADQLQDRWGYQVRTWSPLTSQSQNEQMNLGF